jgi:hypothetical protein
MTRSGDTLYVGGSFFSFGPPSGGAVPVDIDRGLPVGEFPKVAGSVLAVVPDGAGGWFIGGVFGGVDGLPRRNLAHVLANGEVAAWNPSPDGEVRALALAGHKLYVGGRFSQIGGRTRHALAAVDLFLGEATDWAPEPVYFPAFQSAPGPGVIHALVVHGGSVYVGGRFTEIGDASRGYFAALDTIQGRSTSFDPRCDSDVLALTVHKNKLYAGGYFWHIGGKLQRYLGAVDLSADTVTAWSPLVDRVPEYTNDQGPGVLSIAATDSAVFIAGKFNRVGGLKRVSLAAIDMITAAVTEWDAQANGEFDFVPGPIFESVLVRGTAVFVGGVAFAGLGGRAPTTYIGGEFAGALDIHTGRALAWDPRPNGEVSVLAEGGGRICMGGTFTSVRDWVQRPFLAALDLHSGALTDWNPNGALQPWDPNFAQGQMRAMVAYAGRIYVAGGFGFIGGQPRANLAALDAVSGNATPWNPVGTGLIWTLAANEGRIYAGGLFNQIGGEPRLNIAAMDTVSGAVTAWNPGADDLVQCFAFAGDKVYVGGDFSTIGGQTRSAVAAIDRDSGVALDWGPGGLERSSVSSLAVLDTTLYLGSSFNNALIGDQRRTLMAALDLRTGAVRNWDAHFSPVNAVSDGFTGISAFVRDVAVGNGVVYAAGGFSRVGGQRRNFLAALDPVTGDLLDWDPGANVAPRVLEPRPSDLLIAGDIHFFGSHASGCVAAVPHAQSAGRPTPRPPGELAFALHPAAPNPSHASTMLSYELFAPATVDLEVLDATGRRVREVFKHSEQRTGPHQVALNTTGWAPGCYFFLVRARGGVSTRKMLVIK